MINLKKLLEESGASFADSDESAPVSQPVQQSVAPAPKFQPQVNKKLTGEEKRKLLGLVSEFNGYRKSMRMADELKQVAENIVYIAEMTEKYGLNETSEWFEGVSLERDMKELKRNASEIHKLANKIHPQIKMAESLYEEIGLKLEKFFEL